MAASRFRFGRGWPALAVALPFAFGAWLGLGPGRLLLALAGVVVAAFALRVAGQEAQTLRFGRRPRPLQSVVSAALRATGWGALGLGIVLVVAGAWALAGPRIDPPTSDRADGIYELDARVAMRARPGCGPRVASMRVLRESGAHPRLTPEGDRLWFDAAGKDGRRQIHRLDLASGEVACWTCDDPGNNERPSPGERGLSVVFESDRFATAAEPWNREILLVGGAGPVPAAPPLRLTIDPASDRSPVLGPGAQILVWSREADGRSAIVGASIRSGHGGVLLGPATPVVSGGLASIAPLAWSPDARSLLFVRGNPLGTGRAFRLDPATGEATPFGVDVVAAPAGVSADGSQLAVPTARDAGLVADLPAWLGFALGPVARVLGESRPHVEGSGVLLGEVGAEARGIDLGELGAWGAATGVALAPDGRSLVLGQRRGDEERLVEAILDCPASTASSQAP